MFFTHCVILVIAFLTVTLHAQTVNEIKQTPPCILNCVVNAAAEVGCPLCVFSSFATFIIRVIDAAAETLTTLAASAPRPSFRI